MMVLNVSTNIGVFFLFLLFVDFIFYTYGNGLNTTSQNETGLSNLTDSKNTTKNDTEIEVQLEISTTLPTENATLINEVLNTDNESTTDISWINSTSTEFDLDENSTYTFENDTEINSTSIPTEGEDELTTLTPTEVSSYDYDFTVNDYCLCDVKVSFYMLQYYQLI